MKAYLTLSTNDNLSTFIIKRQMGFKTIPVTTSNLQQTVKAVVINLANVGYEVIEQ